MDFLNEISAALSGVAVMASGVLGLLHVRNASKIQSVLTSFASVANTLQPVAASAAHDVETAVHGQWQAALPGLITDALTALQAIPSGGIGAISTPAGVTIVQHNNGTLVPLDAGQIVTKANRATPSGARSSHPMQQATQADLTRSNSASHVTGLRAMAGRS